jgi:hypothetical protein
MLVRELPALITKLIVGVRLHPADCLSVRPRRWAYYCLDLAPCPAPSSEGVTGRHYKAAVKAHQVYETAVVDGGQGGNIVYTFGLVTGLLGLVYQH